MFPTHIPLFPLPAVLFPGAPMPLHVFEPRYRQMVADCLAADRRFGLVNLPDGTAERDLPAGHVGCLAGIEHHEALPDGRSNLLVRGGDRFALVRFVASPKAYLVGEVVPHDDELGDAAALAAAADRVRELFARVARAARTLADDGAPLPPLPDDPALLAFGVAATVALDADRRQRLLASRSPVARLAEVERMLALALVPAERGAEVHERARSNGRGPYHDA